MEYFVRHHQRTIILLAAGLLCAVDLGSAAFSADQSTSQSSASAATLDFANGLYARKMYGSAVTEYEKFLKLDPESPEAASARFRYADSLYFTKDYAAAIAHFDVFLKKFPDDKRSELAKFRLGTSRYYQGDKSRAIQIFSKLSRFSSEEAVRSGSLFYLGKCLEDKDRAEKARMVYGRCIADSPNSEYATYAAVAVGDYFLKNSNLPEALSAYLVAAKNSEPLELTRQARFKVAEIHFSLKRYAEASEWYEKVYEESNDALRTKALLGLFYCDYHEGSLEKAERRFAGSLPTIEAVESKNEIYYLMASLYSDAKKYEEAIRKLDEIIGSKDVSQELREKSLFKKIAVLADSGKKEESLRELDKYFGQGAKSEDKALFEKAQLFADIGRYEEALQAFQRILTYYVQSEYAKSALYQSGSCLVKAGRSAEAKEVFRKYAQAYPDDPNAELAVLQTVQIDIDAKKFHEAFDAAEAIIRQHPAGSRLDIAYYKLGVAATGLERYGHASYAFNKITENYPDSKLFVEALYGNGVTLENDKKLEQAIAIYEKLIREYADHELVKELQARLGYLYIQNNEPGKALTYYEDLLFNRADVAFETDGVYWVVQYLLDQGLYERLDRILDVLDTRFAGKNLTHEKYFFKGESAMGQKRYPEADGFYKQAFDASPQGDYAAHAHLGRGIALTLQNKDAEAETEFAEALRFDHELKVAMRARFEIANLQLKSKRLEEAAKAFMLVAILYDDPKYTPPALYKAGECYRSLGRQDEAEKAFSELKTKYPNSDWAKKA